MATPAETGGAAAPQRLRSPVLVGRATELARAVTVVSAPPSVMVIEGEPGIGKTRLVSELRGHADLRGRRFVVGGCRRIREPFPLGPVLEAVRALGDVVTPSSLSPVIGALRPLLPEIAGRLPPQLPPLDDRQAERHRVFRGLAELLGAAGPAVLVLEDLHWADEHTIDFLGYLLGDPPRQLSVVLTFRGEEVAPAVRVLTSRLPGEVAQGQVAVAPLTDGETGALAAAILGTDQVSGEFASYLCARASGLPLAVEELLALLRARGTLAPVGGRWARRTLDKLDVPIGIRDSVLERASRLFADSRAMLQAAAVLQLPVEVPVLTATGTLPEPRARAALTEALESGLLSWQDGRVGFRHALAIQAVYEDVPPPRRQQLHARAAAAVAARQPVPLGQLAHHLRHAGDLEAWVDAAERAADQAAELGDHDEAVRLLEDVLRHAPLSVDHRVRLTVRLGWAVARATHRADTDPSDLLASALEPPHVLPPELRGELRFLQGLLLERTGGDPDGQRRRFAEAVADLDGRPGLKALAMIGLAVPRVAGVPPAEHRRWLDRVVEILPEIDAPKLRLSVLGKVAMMLNAVGDPRWRRLADQIRDEAGSDARHSGGWDALASVGAEACYSGHHQDAEQLLDTALAGAVQVESSVAQMMCRRSQALLGYCRGAWHGLAEHAAQLGDELRDHAYLRCDVDVVVACLALAHGELDDAAARLGALVGSAETAIDLDLLPVAMTSFVRLELARGEVDAAVAAVTRWVPAWESHRILPPAVRALPSAVEAMLAGGQAPEARALAQRWARLVRDLDAPLAPAVLSQARGSLAAAAGRWDRAADMFLTAAERYRALRCPYEAAQAREHAARCWFAAGDARAQPTLRAALGSYQELGAVWDVDRVAGLARQQGVSLPARHRGGRRGYGPDLSPREREVAELVATGRTNREIARDLYLSTKTVDKHLSAALRKLGLRSRAALAHHLAGEVPPAAANSGESFP
ncbi:MAG: AAA family ATPase [Micromonosporaceae bacterium]|nr:AAA family ATPase [Micromonosporaceae bacterium]